MIANSRQNHIVIAHKKACCGCTSCYAVCPQKAIRMCEDEQGFLYPVVDEGECVHCGLCIDRCPLINENTHESTNRFYAVTNKEENVRAVSSSGGVFSALAENVIRQGGTVYGAAYDASFAVKHIRTDDDSWKRLRTAKYVQSDMGDVFSQVKDDLKQGMPVLFTGTSCQVDGLKNFLKNEDTTSLITCDLICHGVPSPLIWREYLAQWKKKNKIAIGNINFRNKNGCGWHDSTLRIEGTDGSVLLDESLSQAFFSRLFFNHLILRPCCFSCHYANLHRVGDITIGDYWGVEKYHPELDDDKGISLVMVNTDKGLALLEEIKQKGTFVAVSREECMQPNLITPARDYGGRDLFWRSYKRYGLSFAGKRMGYIKTNLWDEACIFVIKVVGKLGRILRKR